MTIRHNAYAGLASSGHEWSVQPHWEDLTGTESQGAAGAALTYAAFRGTPFKLFSFRDAQNDELHLRFQMPHGWDSSTDLNLHLHTVALTDPGADQVVHFAGQYVWVIHDEEIPDNAGWTQFTADVTVHPGDVNKPIVFKAFTLTPPATAHESAILLVYLKRVGGDAADTYAGNLAILSLDVHYQKVKMGTIDEVPEHG